MQSERKQPVSRAPVVEFGLQKLIILGTIVFASIAFALSFTVIGPALRYVGIVFGLAFVGYSCLALYQHHQRKQAFTEVELRRQRALAEREEIINRQEQAKALKLIQPGNAGNYPIWIDEDGEAHVFPTGNFAQPVPQTITYSPTLQSRVSGQDVSQMAAPAVTGRLSFPEPFSLLDIVKQYGVSIDRIFLAMARGEKPLFCDLDNYMHIAQSGPTGSGKTTQWRAEMALLLKAGVQIYLINPHFAPIVMKRGRMIEDWRPIGAALERQTGIQGDFPTLLYEWEEIARFLGFLVTEIDRRMEARRRMQPYGDPIYAFIDEWPAIVDWGRKHKDGRGKPLYDCGGDLANIIRRGRAVEVYISLNSQGFNVQEIGISGAARENFQTAYFLGGDPVSAAAMLDVKQAEFKQLCADLAQQDSLSLGKGVAFFRNGQVSPEVQAVRLGLADDTFVYYLFGHEDHWSLPDRPESVEKDELIFSYDASQEETVPLQLENHSTRGETVPDVLRTFGTPPDKRGNRAFPERPDAGTLSHLSTENVLPGNVRTFPNIAQNPLSEHSDVASEERPKAYRLDEDEIQQFIAAYKASGNMDRALAAIGRGARYRQHAAEVMRAYGLRREVSL